MGERFVSERVAVAAMREINGDVCISDEVFRRVLQRKVSEAEVNGEKAPGPWSTVAVDTPTGGEQWFRRDSVVELVMWASRKAAMSPAEADAYLTDQAVADRTEIAEMPMGAEQVAATQRRLMAEHLYAGRPFPGPEMASLGSGQIDIRERALRLAHDAWESGVPFINETILERASRIERWLARPEEPGADEPPHAVGVPLQFGE